jgi:hypothetical protein
MVAKCSAGKPVKLTTSFISHVNGGSVTVHSPPPDMSSLEMAPIYGNSRHESSSIKLASCSKMPSSLASSISGSRIARSASLGDRFFRISPRFSPSIKFHNYKRSQLLWTLFGETPIIHTWNGDTRIFAEIGHNHNLMLDLFRSPWVVYLSGNREADNNTLVGHTILNGDTNVK